MSSTRRKPTPSSIRLLARGRRTPDRGLIDTSVAIALGPTEVVRLPGELAVSTLTLAELARGPVLARNAAVRVRREELTQAVEAVLKALPFDSACARAFSRVCAAVSTAGRKPGGARTVDLMIAATALAHGLALYTLNAADLRGLEDLIEIVDLDQVSG